MSWSLLFYLLAFPLLRGGFYLRRWWALRQELHFYVANIAIDGTHVELLRRAPKVKQLVADANIEEGKVPVAQAMGYGQIATFKASPLDNYGNLREDMVGTTHQLMQRALGHYWDRFKESASPFFWIEAVVFLPRSILGYLGISGQSAVVKIASMGWWAVGIVGGFIIAAYTDDINALIHAILDKYVKGP